MQNCIITELKVSDGACAGSRIGMGHLLPRVKKHYGTVENMYYQQAKNAEDNADKAVKVGVASAVATMAAGAATALGSHAVANIIAGPIGGAVIGGAVLYAACNEGKSQLKPRKYAKLKNLPMRDYMTTRQPNAYIFDENGGKRDLYYR